MNRIKRNYKDVNLHMIGKLQRTKQRMLKLLIIYIPDSKKLADAVAKQQTNLNRKLKYFIQVNIGNEIQKSGIPVNQLDEFYNYCTKEVGLNVIGLMVIPPNDGNPIKYFKLLNELNKSLALHELSMGMSADYIEAIKCGATFIRVGALFLV